MSPVYEFECTECGEHTDLTLSMSVIGSKAFIFPCPHCGKKAVEMKRVYTTFALRIKKGPTERLGEDMKI